jgi:hypothetical protein
MGVDTQLYISHRWNVEDVRDVLTRRLGYKVKTELSDSSPTYFRLIFNTGGEYDRILHVHTDSEIGGFPAINMNFRSNDEGIAILRKLAESFGGLFAEEDCSGTFEEIQAPDQGNAAYVLKECLKTNPRAGSDTDTLVEMLRSESWSRVKGKK